MIELEEIKQLRTLFKYVSDNSEVIDGIFRDKKIRFTQPAALNDPLEFNPAIRFSSEENNFKRYNCNGVIMPSIHDWHHLNLIESRINEFGILSLTDNPICFEMWCNYANGHKGLLIEFNIPNKTKPTLQLQEGTTLRVYKVRYIKDYMINVDRMFRGGNSIPFHQIRDAIFLRKTRHWKYEREFRIVRRLSDCETYSPPTRRTSYRDEDGLYLFPLSLNCISNVIFGVNTPQEVKEKVIKYCKNTKIEFLQTVIHKDLQNKIDFLPIDLFGPTEKYLAMLPQIFINDSIMDRYGKDYIIINSLSELPYYNLQPKDYEEYYKKKLAQSK